MTVLIILAIMMGLVYMLIIGVRQMKVVMFIFVILYVLAILFIELVMT